jgi:hypothetical protein
MFHFFVGRFYVILFIACIEIATGDRDPRSAARVLQTEREESGDGLHSRNISLKMWYAMCQMLERKIMENHS